MHKLESVLGRVRSRERSSVLRLPPVLPGRAPGRTSLKRYLGKFHSVLLGTIHPAATNELKNRGVHDILIAVVDGLKDLPEAINAVFPETTVQTCIVHLVRPSLGYCSYKDRKPAAAAYGLRG